MVIQYVKAVRMWGLKETLRKMYLLGELKFGDFKGEDTNGNKYYENREYCYGTHRWVEYKDIHNYDASTVTPAWHGWLHHMHDDTPTDKDQVAGMKFGHVTQNEDDNPYKTHLGESNRFVTRQQNLTGFRARGYGIGNIYQKWGEPELYYKQPGHPANPISEEGGRFSDAPDPSPYEEGYVPPMDIKAEAKRLRGKEYAELHPVK